MKRINIVILMLALVTSCHSQNKSNKFLNLDLWKFIDAEDVMVTSFETPGDQRRMFVPYHEFYMQEIGIGEGCMFAISKTYPEDWIKEAPKRNCVENRNARQSIFCLSKLIFDSDTVFLKNQMDLYFFLIEKKDLGPPVSEEAEGGTVVSYYPKKGSTVVVYKYENNKWLELARIKQEGDENARIFGQNYMEKIAMSKMN